MMDKTEVFRANETGIPYLAAFHSYGRIGDFRLFGRMSIGRAGSRGKADIQIPVPSVSSTHGEFGSAEGHWFYRDSNSTNGSVINGEILTGIHEMLDGDILTVVPKNDPDGGPSFAGIFIRLDPKEKITWRRIPFGPDNKPIRIGRTQGGISPEDSMLSGNHAVFKCTQDGLFVRDEGSLNGVYVNGERCEEKKLGTLDIIRLGRSYFVVTEGILWEGEICTAEQNEVESRMKEEPAAAAPGPAQSQELYQKDVRVSPPAAHGSGDSLVIDIDERSVRKNFKKRVLLSDIHLTIEAGDMVLILGGSGAGKSTFMKSVMGYDQADGTILYGDKDVYEDYESMKREIGYVRQQDLVRLSDSVEDTLMAAARLRMPGDSTLREQEERVEWLMDILGLKEERKNLVGAISGGQKKRVSIGIELAADPALFFLDEPDSGLDGPMARGLMEKLKVIADLGKIVLVITHNPDRAYDLFTKALVLGKTQDNVGHMLFYGTPSDALTFFETDRLENIVHRVNRTSEGGEGLADHYYSRFRGLTEETENGKQ